MKYKAKQNLSHSFWLNLKCLQMALLFVSTKLPNLCAVSRSSTSSFLSRRQFHPLSSSSTVLRLPRCRAAVPDPPPPPGNDSTQLQGADVATSLSKFQDRVQIFFAVLFWMSLFFWASAWDGRNRPNKGSRFRR